MKITVLTYLDSEDENSKDYEAVVPQVARTLREPGPSGLRPGRPRRRQAAHRRPVAPQARPGLQSHGDVRRQRLRRHPRRRPARPAGPQVHRQRPGRALPQPGQGPHQEAPGVRGNPLSPVRRLLPAAGVRDRRQPADAALRQAAPLRLVARHRRQIAGARRRWRSWSGWPPSGRS